MTKNKNLSQGHEECLPFLSLKGIKSIKVKANGDYFIEIEKESKPYVIGIKQSENLYQSLYKILGEV